MTRTNGARKSKRKEEEPIRSSDAEEERSPEQQVGQDDQDAAWLEWCRTGAGKSQPGRTFQEATKKLEQDKHDAKKKSLKVECEFSNMWTTSRRSGGPKVRGTLPKTSRIKEEKATGKPCEGSK